MDVIDFKKFVRTSVVVKNFDAWGNLLSQFSGHNCFTYAAADVLMGSLLGSSDAKIEYLYARYGSTPDNPTDSILPLNATGDLRGITRSDFLASTADCGALWVPKLVAPTQTNMGVPYTGNTAQFFFTIPYNLTTTTGTGFGPDKYIAALGLAVSPNLLERSSDIIFSALNYQSFNSTGTGVPFNVATGGQSTVNYTISFLS